MCHPSWKEVGMLVVDRASVVTRSLQSTLAYMRRAPPETSMAITPLHFSALDTYSAACYMRLVLLASLHADFTLFSRQKCFSISYDGRQPYLFQYADISFHKPEFRPMVLSFRSIPAEAVRIFRHLEGYIRSRRLGCQARGSGLRSSPLS